MVVSHYKEFDSRGGDKGVLETRQSWNPSSFRPVMFEQAWRFLVLTEYRRQEQT